MRLRLAVAELLAVALIIKKQVLVRVVPRKHPEDDKQAKTHQKPAEATGWAEYWWCCRSKCIPGRISSSRADESLAGSSKQSGSPSVALATPEGCAASHLLCLQKVEDSGHRDRPSARP